MLTLPTIVIRGAGDLATGVAIRLHRAGLHRLVLLENEKPLAVRRSVAFCDCVNIGSMEVEGVVAQHIASVAGVHDMWAENKIPVLVDPEAKLVPSLGAEVVVDAIIAKRNTGTTMDQAPLVIGMGPGFSAGKDVHRVIETMRGHHLGRVIKQGEALANTGVPGTIAGYNIERVYWAEQSGIFTTKRDIGDLVDKGDILGCVDAQPVLAKVSGVIRGLLRTDTPVGERTKLGDIDPRGVIAYCDEVSDKARSLGGAVLEVICAHLLSGK